jgi:hypothetical protein
MRWLALVLVLLATVARADDDDEALKSTVRVVVDRIENEPSTLGGNRVRVFVSALSLNGGLLDLTDAKAMKATASGSEIKVPYAIGRYQEADANTAIVVVVEATVQYADVLSTIAEAMDTNLLAALDEKHTQLAVLPYGEIVPVGKLAPLKSARSKVSQVQSDGTATDPLLVETVERALALLKKAKTDPEGQAMRKMIILIGDGRDLANDRDRISRLGDRAAREGVRIHSLAFAPTDVRRPLLLLGELSKRSLGTFRWIRSAKSDSWASAFLQLRDEINQQYVFTYFPDADGDLSGKRIKIVLASGATSKNELKVPEPTCAGQTCEAGQYCSGTVCVKPLAPKGRGIFGWILLIGGILVGVIVVLGVIGYFMTKRQQTAGPMDPDAIIAAAQAKAMGSKPPKSVPPGVQPQDAQVQAHAAAVVASATLTGPRFYIASGPRMGEQVGLKNGFTIGKQTGNDLLIDDGFTSSQHAQIGMDQFGNCRIYDRGSTNGTYVNGQRVTEYVLEHGMAVRIGSTELRYLAQ